MYQNKDTDLIAKVSNFSAWFRQVNFGGWRFKQRIMRLAVGCFANPPWHIKAVGVR